MIRKNLNKIILVGIILLAASLRVYRLPEVPVSLSGDETDVGYQAYSLLKTGRDYRGQFLPTYIHSFAEWRAPMLMYVTVPFVAIFGLNEYGVRLPPALFGTLNTLLLYLLVRLLFRDNKWAVLSALVSAINPWSIHYSRIAFEVTLLSFLFLSGSLCFVRGLNKPRYFLAAAALFGLTLYTYNTANVFLPLLLGGLFLVYKERIGKMIGNRLLWAAVAIFLAIITPFVYQVVSGKAQERFALISVFADPTTIEEIHLKRLGGFALDVVPPKPTLAQKIFTNRPVYWTNKIVANYLSSFSPGFLFAKGDPDFSHSVGNVGEFYPVEFLLVIIGLFALLRTPGRQKWIIIFWLIFAPLPSALTREGGNHATRLFLMIPPLIILSAYGLFPLFKLAKKSFFGKAFFLLAVFLWLFNFGFYLNRYFFEYPKESWRHWQYGYKEAMTFLKEEMKNYQSVIISDSYEPSLIRYLFWTAYDPLIFAKEFSSDKYSEEILPGFAGFKLGNVYFGRIKKLGWWDTLLTQDVLFLASQKEDIGGDWDWRKDPPFAVKVLQTVTDPSGWPIFYLVTHD